MRNPEEIDLGGATPAVVEAYKITQALVEKALGMIKICVWGKLGMTIHRKFGRGNFVQLRVESFSPETGYKIVSEAGIEAGKSVEVTSEASCVMNLNSYRYLLSKFIFSGGHTDPAAIMNRMISKNMAQASPVI